LLGEVDEVATARALREHFELAKRELGEKQADIERLTRRFMEARSVLPEVMRSLGKGMYPALLKQVGKTFRSYDELMVLERESLLDFVGATSEEVLDYDPDLDRPATADGPVPSEAARAHPAAEPAQHAPLTAGTLKGLELLEQLFPQAGWERLQEWPDLYAYFQPILRFPRGFEHIARTDPLHQLLIFVSVLGELLPPLRKVEFTQLVGETDLRANLAGIADRWHAFTHEIFGNLLVPRLADLCQNLEREPKYLDSTMAQRMRDEINWVRRGYFLPHMAFTQTFPVDAVVRKELPKFHQTVASLRQSLAAVARSLDDSVRAGRAAGTPIQETTCPGVGNPWVEINFEVDSPVARRLRMALRQRVVGANGEARLVNKFNNANLVFHTLSLCITFDHLVNSRGSHLYSAASGIHFRSVLDDNRTPASAVAFVGTEAMLGERVNPERARATLAALRHQISSDPDTGLGTRAALHERAQQAIADSRGNSSPLSVVALSLAEATAQGDRASGPPATSTVTGVALALVDDAAEAETVLEVYRDGPASFTILAPGQDYPAVVKLTHRILAQIDGAFSQVVVTAGVAQFSGRGREGELLAQAVAARRLATKEGARVALADPRSGELRLAPLGEDP
jgi:GGDEF domain-containing protein